MKALYMTHAMCKITSHSSLRSFAAAYAGLVLTIRDGLQGLPICSVRLLISYFKVLRLPKYVYA